MIGSQFLRVNACVRILYNAFSSVTGSLQLKELSRIGNEEWKNSCLVLRDAFCTHHPQTGSQRKDGSIAVLPIYTGCIAKLNRLS
jgi:hypothetical protein